ncbi:MAG TPA: hypothetical protein VJI32_06350 [Candidatus Nanoarchaeia archaeon]|nr:hypothetical protein [Candidatus Nanoarchaeia archaeon]
MNFRSLALAVLIPILPTLSSAAETPPPKTIEQRVDDLAEEIEDSREERLNLGLEYGIGYSDEITYDIRGAALGINGYLVAFRFREERSSRKSPDSLKVAGFTLEGTRKSRRYNADITLGYAFLQHNWRHADVKLYGHVLGSIQLDTSILKLEGEDIPGPVDVDFLLGGGARAETAFRIPSLWTYIPLSIGIGGTAEYLRQQVDKIAEEARSGISVAGYAFVRISRNRE